MTRREFVCWLNDLEASLPVAEWRVGDVRVWPLIRLELYARTFNAIIAEAALTGSRLSQLRTVARTHGSWASARLRDWRRDQARVMAADAVFLGYSIGLQPLVGGRCYNPLVSPYADLLGAEGRSVLVWEMAPYGRYNIPRYTPSHLIQPYLLRQRFWSVVRPRRDRAHLPGHDRFVDAIRREGFDSRYLNAAALQRDAGFIRALADDFRGWLNAVRPLICFNADYGLRDLAFLLACREARIPSVEIQHGAQGNSHPVYATWAAVPGDGYELRPWRYWCWDAESADAINAWATRAGDAPAAFVGGDAWREPWLIGDTDLVRASDAIVRSVRDTLGARQHVLITLDSLGEPIPPPLEAALAALPRDWAVWVRLHPANQDAQRPRALAAVRRLPQRAADVLWVSGLPLHAMLRHVDLHVTVSWSSVVREAAAFGVRSVACAEPAAELFSGEVARGDLIVAVSADAIARAMEAQVGRPAVGRSPVTVRAAAVMRQLVAECQSRRDGGT